MFLFPPLSLSLSVYVSVFCAFSSLPFYHMCKFVYSDVDQSPDTECFHPQRSLVLPFDNHTHFPPLLTPP